MKDDSLNEEKRRLGDLPFEIRNSVLGVVKRIKRFDEGELEPRHLVNRDAPATVQGLQGFGNAVAVDANEGELGLDGHQQASQPPCLDLAPIALYGLESVLGTFSFEETIDDLRYFGLRKLSRSRLDGTPVRLPHARGPGGRADATSLGRMGHI